MSKTIKSILLISILLFAFLESASSAKLRALQTETSFNLGETDNPTTTTDTSDSFVLGEGDPTESKPENTDNAANYDLGDADASQAPAPTTSSLVGATAGTSEVPKDATSFVLGDEDNTQTVPNTQSNVATTSESNTFDLGDADTVGVSTSTSAGDASFDLSEGESSAGTSTSPVAGETSFELKEDESVGVSTAPTAGVTSFDLQEDVQEEAPSDSVGASNAETSFELTDEDNTNNVDLTDPADASSSTDKTGANPGGRALSSNENVTVTASAKAGVSLQTGIVLSLVAVVSALVL